MSKMCQNPIQECNISAQKAFNPTDFKENMHRIESLYLQIRKNNTVLVPDIDLKYLRETLTHLNEEVCINKLKLPRVGVPITSTKPLNQKTTNQN